MNRRVIYSILFFVLCMFLISISKPSFVFKHDGNLKNFGIRRDDSLLSFGSISVVMSMLTHLVFGIIDLIAISTP